MRRILILCLVIFVLVLPVSAQKPGGKGTSITTESIEATCPNGVEIQNGVEFIVNMRPGFTYTATVLGINDFDPVIGVGDESGIVLCEDDVSAAGRYSVDLPSSGGVAPSGANSQVPFNHSYDSFADISLVVGSTDGSAGEFVLILEGMAVTTADGSGAGAGDPFTVRLTQNMVDSGVLNVYMIAITNNVDPLMQLVDTDKNVIELDNGDLVQCDDAGDSEICWGDSADLSNSFVSRTQGRQTPGGPRDAMLSIPVGGFELDSDPDNNFLNFLMTTYRQETFGDYLVVFHSGTGTGGSGQPSLVPTPQGGKGGSAANAGVTATCPDGTQITNAVEIVVNMRPDFTYTATALGLDGFDPIIGVGDQNGVSLCQDDDRAAASYTVNLPSSGSVDNANTNSQVPFSHSYDSFADISLIVGGLDGSTGSFVLILEGMAVTTADGSGAGAGDPFAVRITQNMVDSGIPLSVYMIAVTNDLDPLMQLVDSDKNVITLDSGARVECDDAGDSEICFGDNTSLNDAFVSRTQGRQTPGGPRDSMLSFDLSGFVLDPDPDLNFLQFLMTSYRQETFGDYLVVFHIGVGTGAGTGGKPNV